MRYPGSKRRMLTFLAQHLPTSDELKGCYAEPFAGSAAVFFFINPRNAILADVNPDLIDLLRGIQSAPSKVWQIYCEFGDTKKDYQHARDEYKPISLEEKAARVLYLNRTCFKGMWRTNRNGDFNVGYGGQARRWVINEENLIDVSTALQRAQILCTDFEAVIYEMSTGDFLFLDPPYRPGEKDLFNDHYMGKTFTFADHQRLASVLNWAKRNGIDWAMTTSAHKEIVCLFQGNCFLELPQGTGKSPGIISRNSGEVLITSYPRAGGIVI